MDRIFRHLGPVLAQINKTCLFWVNKTCLFWRALRASFGAAFINLKNLRRTKLEKFTLAVCKLTPLFYNI